jgi:hypothetical protein
VNWAECKAQPRMRHFFEVNELRRRLIGLAFDKLDVDRSGAVTLGDVRQLYDVRRHPDVAFMARR